MLKKQPLTVERLKEVLDYDPGTGVMRWKAKTARGTKVGDVAGANVARNGYRYISIDLRDHLVQRLAWAHYFGKFPEHRVTFRNDDKSDCRIENLVERKRMHKTIFDHTTPEGRSIYQRAHRAKFPDKYRSDELFKSFGITLDEYKRMLTEQNGLCAVCHEPETEMRAGKLKALAVDHNHTTGAVRGLLCSACNKAIGLMCEDPSRLASAISYLERYPMMENVIELKQRRGMA